MTVGKTHSGKTTFGKELEKQLDNSVVIDQDNHAEFINTYYKRLQPMQGPNKLKYTITRSIVDYAVHQTNAHLILCNSNRSSKGRIDLLAHFQNKGFITIIVSFEIPDPILQARIAHSQRSTVIFRSASNFEEVLLRQQAEDLKGDVSAPVEGEADHLFVMKDTDDVRNVVRKIVDIAQSEL